MPQLFSALRVLGRHTVMKSALDTSTGPRNPPSVAKSDDQPELDRKPAAVDDVVEEEGHAKKEDDHADPNDGVAADQPRPSGLDPR